MIENTLIYFSLLPISAKFDRWINEKNVTVETEEQ
jgi:hypothetical protein